MAKKKIFFVLAIIIILFTSLLIEKDMINKILYPRRYSEYVEISVSYTHLKIIDLLEVMMIKIE